MVGCENRLGIWGLSLWTMAGATMAGGASAYWFELGDSGLGSTWVVAVQNKGWNGSLVKGFTGWGLGDGDGSFD